MSLPRTPQRRTIFATALRLAGGLIGAALGIYSGFGIVIPVLIAVVAGWLLAKALAFEKQPLVPAAALLIGHAGWMLTGSILTGRLAGAGLDLLVLIAGAAWLLLRPGLTPALVLGSFQLIGILLDGFNLAGVATASAAHRAIVVHIVLRASSLALLWTGVRAYRFRVEERRAAQRR